MTEGIAKFWWVMSILFVVLSIAVVLALRCSHSHWVQAVVVAGWLFLVGENRDKADMAFRYDVACCGAMACN